MYTFRYNIYFLRKVRFCMKRLFLWGVFLGILAITLSCSSPKPMGKNGKLTIIYSGNIGARYDPCGCRIPLGGLARRSTVIKDIKSTTNDVLILDTGSLIFERHNLYPPYEETSRMTAHLVADTMNNLSLDAVNVSSMDLAAGPDTLLTIARGISWPWLSANVIWKDSGNLVFAPDIMKTIAGFRVGVFGFMDRASVGIPLIDERAPITVLDPVETARKEVEKLKKEGAELVIALAYMDKDNVEQLIQNVSGINLMVYGHTHEHNPSSDHIHFLPYKVNETIVARCPDGGRVLGVMKLEIWNGLTQFVNGVQNADLRPAAVKKAEKPENKKSIFENEFIDLGPSIQRDRAIQDQLDATGKKIEELREKLRKESEKNDPNRQ